MQLFVTGATGFVGSHFVKRALKLGHDVVALRRRGSRPRIELNAQPTWIEGELGNGFSEALRQCDVLVHLAAYGVDPEQSSWDKCFRINVNESLRLWMDAIDQGVSQLLICGSCFEYGTAAERFTKIPPTAPLEPVGPYHSSKAAATMAAIGIAKDRNVRVSVVRPFHVFGEGEAEHRFWPTLRAAAFAGDDFEMTAGEQVRDFVPVEVVVDQLLDAASSLRTAMPGQATVRNLGTGEPRSLRDFAEECWKMFGASGELRFGKVPYRPNEVMRYVPEVMNS